MTFGCTVTTLPNALIFSLEQYRPEGDNVPAMVPQPQAAEDEPRPQPAPLEAEGRERRWPLFWTVFGALAASAALWAIIYFLISAATGLIGDALR